MLVVVPDGRTPFEAYNPILDRKGRWGAAPVFTDPTPRGITFEGFYEWMVHSEAYAEHDWKNARPWNAPTSLTLAPGESKSYGVKFLVSDSIRTIEKTLCGQSSPRCGWSAGVRAAPGHGRSLIPQVRQGSQIFEG